MMRCGLVIFGSLFIWDSCQAGELRLQLQQPQIEWGQVINAKLIALDAATELAEIDLAPLYADFAVIVNENVRGDSQVKKQTLILQLYPRRTGTLIVPALTLGDLHSREQPVKVSSAMVGGTALVVDMKISARKVWQRQQILATVNIKSADRFFQMEAEPFKLSGFEVRPFVMAREPIDNDPHYRSLVQLGWAIFPLVSGEFTLEPPMLSYVQGGITKRKFFLPRIDFQVRELPAYIPPNMPVAKVRITSSIVTEGLLRTGHLAYWNITLSAKDTLAYWLPPVLHNVQSTNQIDYLPAKSRHDLHIDADGVRAQVIHEVPFKPRRTGTVDLPRLKLQYFDPDTGRIESIYYQTPPVTAWNAPIIMLFAVLMIVLLVRGASWLIQRYTRHRQRESAILAVSEAGTAKEIQLGLRRYAAAEGWPANLTLSDFLRIWQQRYCTSTELTILLQRMSQQLYGGALNLPLENVQTNLVHLLRQRRQRRKSPHRPKISIWDSKNIFIR